MRFFAPVLSVLAAIAVAQTSQCTSNCILVPQGGLVVTAGQPITLTWSNPTSGKITIKLQNGVNITPNSGTTLTTVDASTGTATVTIPDDLPASNQYTFETIDEDNSSVYNFSPMFSINGATGVSSMATSTGSSASTASTGTASTGSSSVTSTASSESSSSSGSTRTTASRTSSQSASNTSSSSMTTATTAAPNANTGANMKVEGAMLALIAGVAALL